MTWKKGRENYTMAIEMGKIVHSSPTRAPTNNYAQFEWLLVEIGKTGHSQLKCTTINVYLLKMVKNSENAETYKRKSDENKSQATKK